MSLLYNLGVSPEESDNRYEVVLNHRGLFQIF